MLKLFNKTLYVQVKQDAFSIFHVQENRHAEILASTPFSSSRLAVGRFKLAEATFKKGLEQLAR